MSNPPTTEVKICGLKTPELVKVAANAGADYIGFNHYPKSPRFVDPAIAQDIAKTLPPTMQSVALFVNPEDEAIKAASWANWIQLHGSESPARCEDIRKLTGARLLKALPVSEASDLTIADTYGQSVDMLLFDSKPHELPGGNGIAFDWHLLQNASFHLPWMLSGGLNPENVAEAIEVSGATRVDVASGVEISRGEKSADLIRAFIKAAKEQG